MKKINGLLLSTITAAFLVGCGGGGGSSSGTTTNSSSTSTVATTNNTTNSISISGTIIGNGYAKLNTFEKLFNKIITPAYALNVGAPDKIVAVSNYGKNIKLFDINPDGSFEIDTSILDGNDLVFFIGNNSTKEIFGHLKLPVPSTNENVDFIDKSALKNNLSFGSIDSENDCSSSETTGSVSSSFDSMALSKLESLARNDDGMILYENDLKNENIESYVAIRFNIGTMQDIDGQFNNLATDLTTNNFRGMSPLFYLDASIGTNITSIDLYPSSAIKHSGNVTPTTVLTSYLNDANSTTPITKTGLSFNSSAGVTTIEMPYVDSFPTGNWILKNHVDNSTLGSFKFSNIQAFTGNTFRGIVPKIKILKDTNGNITSIIVQFYKQDSNGIYTLVDNSDFSKIANGEVFSYVLNSGNGSSANFTRDTNNSSSTDIVFKASTNINFSDVNRIIYSYKIGQAKYQFFIEGI